MSRRVRVSSNAMVQRLVFRLLPVQVMIVAMGSINTLVDGIVASRYISPATVGVVGLYFSMLRIMDDHPPAA